MIKPLIKSTNTPSARNQLAHNNFGLNNLSPENIVANLLSNPQKRVNYSYSSTTVTNKNGMTSVNIKKHHYQNGALKIEELQAQNQGGELYNQTTQHVMKSIQNMFK